MKTMTAGIRKPAGILFLTFILLLTGCAGPSTRVLPREESSVQEQPAETGLLSASEDGLREILEAVASEPRPAGSASLRAAGDYLSARLVSFGYEVTGQDGILTAVRRTVRSDADILLAAAEYGTEKDCPGAFTNGAGTAVLLETARILASVPSDTELRLYFLPVTSEDPTAAQSLIPEEGNGEVNRILGLVRVGAFGAPEGLPPFLVTPDGNDTFLTSCIKDSAAKLSGWQLDTLPGDRSACSVFERSLIPAVSFEETVGLYEQGTPLERPELLDVSALAQAADILSLAFAELMDEDSLSMQAKAHYYNDIRDTAYVQRRDAVLPFGEGRDALESLTGQTGALTARNTDGEGRSIEAWQYPMKWFGVDQIVPTTFYYLDGSLFTVVPDGDSVGIDTEDMMERVTSFYGTYTGFSDTPSGMEYEWTVPRRRLAIRLVPESDGYELSFSAFDAPRIPVKQESLGADVLKSQVERIFPEEALERLTFTVYTDGIGGTAGYLEPAAPAETEEEQPGGETETGDPVILAELGLDAADAVDENGFLTDETRTVRLLIGLYAEYLQLEQPDHYTDPDFADNFLIFLLTDEPDDPFFSGYAGYEELVSYRQWVREQLNRG